MPNDRLSDNMGRLARAVEALYPTLSKIAGDNGGRGVDPGIGEDGRVRPSGRAADPGRAAVVGITVTGGSAEAVKAAPGLASAMALMKSVGAGGPAAFERSAAAMARALSALAGPSGVTAAGVRGALRAVEAVAAASAGIGPGAVRGARRAAALASALSGVRRADLSGISSVGGALPGIKAAAKAAEALAGVKDPKADLSWIPRARKAAEALAGIKDPKADLSWIGRISESLAGVKDPGADLSWIPRARKAADALAGIKDPGTDLSWIGRAAGSLAGVTNPKADLSWISEIKRTQRDAAAVRPEIWAGLEAAAGSIKKAADTLASAPGGIDLSGLAAGAPDGLMKLAAAGKDGSLDGLASAGAAISAFASAAAAAGRIDTSALAGLRGIKGDELDGLAALSKRLSAAGSVSAAARNISALAGAVSGISADPASAARTRRAVNAVFREIGRIRIDPAAAESLKKLGARAGDAVAAMAEAAAAVGTAEVPAGAARKARRIGRVFREIGAAARDMAAGLTARDAAAVAKSAAGYEAFIRLSSGLSLRLTAAALLAPAAIAGAAALRLELDILGKHIKEIASMSADNDNAAKNIKAMTGFVLALGGLTALTAGIALVIDGRIIGAMAAEAVLCGMLIGAARLALTMPEKDAAAADRNVRSLSVLAGTLTAMTAGIAAVSWAAGSGRVLATIGITAAAAGMLIGTARLLSRIDGMEKAEKGAEALALFSGSLLAVTGGIVVLSKAMENTDGGSLLAAVGLMTVTGAALIGAAALMAKAGSDDKAVKGAAAMALFATTSIGMMTAVVLLSKISGFDEGGGSKIWQTVLLMTAVTGVMAGTAFLVSRFGLTAAPGALVGIAALAAIGFGMAAMTAAVMSMSKDYDGKKVWSTFGLMAAVTAGVIGVGALLAAAAPVTLAALAGGLAFLAVSTAITDGIRSIVRVRALMAENGLDKPDADGRTWITSTIRPVLDETMGLFAGIDMPVKMSAVRRGKRAVMKVVKALDGIVRSMVTLKKAGIEAGEAVGYAAGMKTAVSGFMTAVTDMLAAWEKSADDGLKIHRGTIRKQKKALKNVGRLVGVTRGLMKIIRDFDRDGKDGRNMIDSAADNAATLSAAVLSFTTAFFAGDEFENAIGESFRRTRRSMKMVNRLVRTSSRFMSMMNGIGDKTRADMEKSAPASGGTEFEAKGRQISDALLRFTAGFFGGMAALDKTVDERMRSARKPLKNLRRLVGIVPNFLSALQKYTDMTTGDGGRPTADDLMANAESLAAIVANFTGTLFGKFQELSEPGTVRKNIKNLRRVIKPVTSLVETLASYDSGDGETLARVSVVNGKIERTGTVNVTNVSKAIISAVTLFLKTMYAKENIDRWNELSGRELNRGAAVLGKLGVVIEPVTAFTEMLLKFKDGGLLDKDGKVQPIEPVGAAIAGTVVNFLNTLYSDDNKRMWRNMSRMSAEDGRSALSAIIDPVESFVKMISDIGAGMTADGVMTIKTDGGAERKVNMPSIARQLSGGFKAFADAVEGAADPKRSKTAAKAIEKSAASVSKAFREIDGVLAKSRNDSRVAELRRLTEEIQKLAESVDKIDMEKIKEQVELLKTQTSLMQAEAQREYAKKGQSVTEQVDEKFGAGSRGAAGGNVTAEQPKVTPAVIDPVALAQAFVTAMSNSPWTMTVIDDKNIMFTVDGD